MISGNFADIGRAGETARRVGTKRQKKRGHQILGARGSSGGRSGAGCLDGRSRLGSLPLLELKLAKCAAPQTAGIVLRVGAVDHRVCPKSRRCSARHTQPNCRLMGISAHVRMQSPGSGTRSMDARRVLHFTNYLNNAANG